MRQDRREQVVHVVRDLPGQPARRLHLPGRVGRVFGGRAFRCRPPADARKPHGECRGGGRERRPRQPEQPDRSVAERELSRRRAEKQNQTDAASKRLPLCGRRRVRIAVISVVMIRDLGNLRVPPALVTIASAILLAVTAYALHRRDELSDEHRAEAPVG